MYQLTKLIRDAQDKIDETSNVKIKQELQKIQEKILEARESEVQLSQYEIDYMQKELDIEDIKSDIEQAKLLINTSENEISLDTTLNSLDRLKVDKYGLDQVDIEYLEALIVKFINEKKEQ